jgi:O-antigen ligase
VFEPFSNLGPSYFNHAHNDVLELLIEGGLGGGLLLVGGIAWWVRQTLRAWQGPDGSDSGALARAGSAITLIFGLASLTDYPLRTPICSVVFLLACCFMCVQRSAQASDSRDQLRSMPVK